MKIKITGLSFQDPKFTGCIYHIPVFAQVSVGAEIIAGQGCLSGVNVKIVGLRQGFHGWLNLPIEKAREMAKALMACVEASEQKGMVAIGPD